MSHSVRLTEEAQADLLRLYDFLLEQEPDSIRTAESAQGISEQVERKAGAADRDGMQGANRSDSRCYREDEQRSRPPESADARDVRTCSEVPSTSITRAFEFLRSFPFSCRKASPHHPYVRELIIPFGSTGYVALFEIEPDGFVTILAVRHQRESDYH